MAIIKGLKPALAEVGKIKTGYKGREVTSKNNKKFRPPKKLDYFVITTTERDDAGNLIPNKEIMKKLGDKPKELKIRLPFDSIDKNFFTEYQCYSGGKKKCAGNGVTAERKGTVEINNNGGLILKDGGLRNVKCDPETCPILQAGKCKVSGILSAFLPEADDLGGVYKYRTHSYNAVSSILAALEYFKLNTGGILQGLPLKLVMVKKTTAEHGNINYTTVVIDGGEIRYLRQLASEEKQSRLLLGTDISTIEQKAEEAGFFKDSDPEDEIQAEYYVEDEEPESVVEEIEQAIEETEPEPPKEAPKKQSDLF